jgi:ligand-binding SRPBCC domain-containing protein
MTPAETRSFEYRHVVRRGIADTFAFFSEPANLPRLTPRLLGFRVVERPGQVERGSQFRYRMGPVQWVAEIAAWDPPRGFADVQVRGPYSVWRHRHELSEVAGGTEVRDRVDYRLRGGIAGRALDPLHRVFLRALFTYRSRRLDELLAG